ncbi:MAG: DegV family protein [Lachnospiraceae bacterium]|nr:DegV family protein [Lachnospiraceae bacterium]
MGNIAIVTDSNSRITADMAAQLGITVIPMPFSIDGEEYYEDINLTQDEFYKKLDEGAEISTSQPAIGKVMDLWNDLLKDHDQVLYIPMSSSLSSSCATAMSMADEFDGKVFVVNNQRISVTLKQSVFDAIKLAKEGKDAEEIKEILENDKLESSIYITVDNLKYLKKGGRVTTAGAAIATVLNIKPVLTIQGEKLDAFAKTRGIKAAKSTMIEAISKDINERFTDYLNSGKLRLSVVHTMNEEIAKELRDELAEMYPMLDVDIDILSLSVACHIGPGSLAVACSKIE